MKNSDLKYLYTMVELSGAKDDVFFSGGIYSADHFVEHVKKRDILLCAIIEFETRKMVGFSIFDHFKSKTAYVHFYFNHMTKTLLSEIPSMGRNIMRIMKLDLLIGIIPQGNRKALRFAEMAGSKTLGVLPKSSYNPREGRSVDSLLVYFERVEG